MKSSIKNEIIKDYIVIKTIHNECVGLSGCEDLKLILCKANKLIRIYEKLIFKFGLMDLSFCLLNKETNCKMNLDSANVENVFRDSSLVLEKIESELTKKFKKLKINEFEAKFLIMDKCN